MFGFTRKATTATEPVAVQPADAERAAKLTAAMQFVCDRMATARVGEKQALVDQLNTLRRELRRLAV